ncbi:hypothetical protein H1R20_g5979, partial [Candolleomyces eurysporus]
MDYSLQQLFTSLPRGQALELLPSAVDNGGSKAEREIFIAKLFISRYKHTGQIVDLDDTISAVKRAVALFTEDEDGDPVDIAVQLTNLGKFYKLRFERTNQLEDLNDSISNQQTSVGITPDEYPQLPYWMDNLATSLAERFDLTKNMSDIDDAIQTFRTALEERGLHQGHRHIPHLLYNLSIALLRRSEAGCGSSSLADLDNAISNRSQALSLFRLQQGHTTEELSTWINATATLIVQRFERTNSLVDLEESIRLQQESIDLLQGKLHRRVPLMLSNLAASFYHKFQFTGRTKCLEEAIEAEQKALSLSYRQDQTPPQMNYSRRLGYERLALWNFRLSERTGRLADIDEALSFQKKLLEMTPPKEYGARSELLGNLGLLLHTRFLRSGKIEDINEAIRTLQAAKAVYQHRPLGFESSNGPIGLYNNLGNSLARRFERTGNLVDLDEAISNQKSAVDLVPDSNQTLKSSSHNNLGISLTFRFERTGAISDIEDAITSLRNAVALSVPLPETDKYTSKPNDILVTVTRMNNLSIALLRRFERGSALEDIQEAILHQQKVVQFTPHGHPDLPARLNNLGRFLYARFNRMDDASDLTTAISCQLKAVDLLPNDHPDLPAWLNNLGGSFLTRMNKTSNSSASDIDRATTAFQRAIELTPADHASRPMLFHNLGNAFSMHFKATDVLQYAEEAISTLETAISLTADDDAHLPSYLKSMADDEIHQHVKVSKDYNEAIEEARRIPGFEAFNLPFASSSIEELSQNLPEEGRVVLINVNQHRCDALVLMAGCQEPGDLIHVPLSFSLEMVERLHGKLTDELTVLASRDGLQELEGSLDGTETERSMAPRSRRTWEKNPIGYILGELWQHVVKPILDAVAITRSESPTTRIWWCPTGPLAFLPIHAAGKYMGGRDPAKITSIFDYAISSYTPTVSALTNAFKRRKLVAESVATTHTQTTPTLLLVNQSNAPGLTPIPGTTQETRAIARLSLRAGFETFSLDGAQATIDSVIAKINDFSSIHLACHAFQNTVEPLRSGFALHDGRLELSKLIQTRHSRNDGSSIAFLSACQTSTGDVRLSDEAVHLAAGMIAAGYTEVVGTMWSIQDRYAPKVAEDFYKYLFAGSEREGGPYGGRGAYSLFQSLNQLRRTLKPDSPISYLAWVPYVHFGI